MHMLQLPDEVWASRILSLLGLKDVGRFDSALLVRQFRPRLVNICATCVLDEVLITKESVASWVLRKGLQYDSLSVHISEELLVDLSIHCPRLRRLDFRWALLFDSVVAKVRSNWTGLVSLCLGNCACMSPKAIEAVGRNCPNLQRLFVRKLEPSSECDSAFLVLASNCPGLQDITFDQTLITDLALMHIADHCAGLKRLSLINSCTSRTQGVIAIASSCPYFEELYIANCCMPDEAFIAVGEYCRNLSTLHLDEVRKVTDIGLLAVAEHCPTLRSLTLYETKIHGATLTAFCKHCPMLEVLRVDSLRNDNFRTLQPIAEHLPNLQLLYLSVGTITNEDLVTLVERCRKLESLTIRKYMAEPATNDTLARIVRNCTKLTELKLSMG